MIPCYGEGAEEDCVDLQIRSLMYMFKRCDIVNSKPFSNAPNHNLLEDKTKTNINNKGKETAAAGGARSETEKLDLLYNKAKFDLLFQDEHKIMIDWAKNKFRSLCILSSHPVELKTLPKFEEPNFSFVVLGNDASEQQYIDILSNSDIYIEHLASVDVEARKKIVKNALALVKGGASRSLSKDERAFIVRYYLNKVATEVQVERLYRGMILKSSPSNKQKAETNTGTTSPETPQSRSPERPVHIVEHDHSGSGNRYARSPTRMGSPDRYNNTDRRKNMSPDRMKTGVTKTPERSPERGGGSYKPHSNVSPANTNKGPRKMKSSSALMSPERAPGNNNGTPPRANNNSNSKLLNKQSSVSNLKMNLNEVPNLTPHMPVVASSYKNHHDHGEHNNNGDALRAQLLSQARIAVKKKLDNERLTLKRARAADRKAAAAGKKTSSSTVAV